MEALQSPADVPKAFYQVTMGALRFIGDRLTMSPDGWDETAEPPKASIEYFTSLGTETSYHKVEGEQS